MRESITIQKKSFALFAGVALAATLAAGAIAPSQALASDVPWNDNVTVTAMGMNSTDPKSEAGQYDHVVMQFKAGTDFSTVTDDQAKSYLEKNIRLANRTISATGANASNYVRPLENVKVSDDADTITFDIMANTKGTTANYSGELLINSVAADNLVIANAMGNAAVETLIDNGVEIASSDGVLNADRSKTFQIASGANTRGMVHILVTERDKAIFNGTGTFSNGGFTVHAHQFTTQTPADFATLICSTANGLAAPEGTTPYTFTAGENGSFTISHGGASCARVKVFIYDCNYLNDAKVPVGSIGEPEMVNP